jgi:hypothetical protein
VSVARPVPSTTRPATSVPLFVLIPVTRLLSGVAINLWTWQPSQMCTWNPAQLLANYADGMQILEGTSVPRQGPDMRAGPCLRTGRPEEVSCRYETRLLARPTRRRRAKAINAKPNMSPARVVRNGDSGACTTRNSCGGPEVGQGPPPHVAVPATGVYTRKLGNSPGV